MATDDKLPKFLQSFPLILDADVHADAHLLLRILHEIRVIGKRCFTRSCGRSIQTILDQTGLNNDSTYSFIARDSVVHR